ncbi:MAG: NAD(P)/FAD-dependent oxidoreductase [Ferruginibacter sp.]
MNKKLVVIGGGAAGFFCAVNVARSSPSFDVILIEKTGKLLSKVKVSGGGRCNVTHACFSMAEMVKKYPRGSLFLKKAFHHFFTTDTIHWFEERGVKLKTEADGRMFPETDSSQTIIDCLLSEASKYGVDIRMNTTVISISKSDNGWDLLLNNKNFHADHVCIATGGYNKAEQFNWITDLGHKIESPVPSLFTFNIPGNEIAALMGISVENVTIKVSGTKLQEKGPLLITHWGFSGPAVLKLSAWGARELAARKYNFNIVVNWLPEFNEITLKEKIQQVRFEIASQKISNRNPFMLPARLWEYFLKCAVIDPEIRWADLPAKEQNRLVKLLTAQEFQVKGKTTFKEEFVTAGGVELSEVDVNTMQSKMLQGLFFCGEILNVDGITGGYNFQNAWTTAWIASQGITNSPKTIE